MGKSRSCRTKLNHILIWVMISVFLVSCSGSSDLPVKNNVENEAGEISDELSYLKKLNGSWEGVFSEHYDYKIMLDCSIDEGIAKVTINLVSDIWSFYYLEAERKIENESLTLWWNDDEHRSTITFKFNAENKLEGVFSQYPSHTSSAEFIKVSDTASTGEFCYNPPKTFKNSLVENSNFDRTDSIPIDFEYAMDNPNLDILREKYGLDDIAGNGDTQSKAVNLLNWVSVHTNHKGDYDNHVIKNSIELLEYAYDKDSAYGVNCYNLSIILTEACLSIGIKARCLFLMPGNPEDLDNHVVVMAYIPEYEKWIMLDPSFNSYLSDIDGNILSPLEVRQKIVEGKDMSLNPEVKNIDYTSYINYLSKDMFYFYSVQTTSFGVFEEEPQRFYLCPVEFDLTEWIISNMYFKNSYSHSLSDSQLKEREIDIRARKNVFAAPDSFWGV